METPESLLREAKEHLEGYPTQQPPGSDEELEQELLEWEKRFIVLLCRWVTAVAADTQRLQRFREVVGFLDSSGVNEKIERAKGLVGEALDKAAASDLPAETVAHLQRLAAELERADLRRDIYPLKRAYAAARAAACMKRLQRLATELEGDTRRPPSLWPDWDEAAKQVDGIVIDLVKTLSFGREAELYRDASQVLDIYTQYWPQPDERIVGKSVGPNVVIYDRPKGWRKSRWSSLCDAIRRLTEHLCIGNENGDPEKAATEGPKKTPPPPGHGPQWECPKDTYLAVGAEKVALVVKGERREFHVRQRTRAWAILDCLLIHKFATGDVIKRDIVEFTPRAKNEPPSRLVAKENRQVFAPRIRKHLPDIPEDVVMFKPSIREYVSRIAVKALDESREDA